jgi:hypothetical protein
MASDKRKFSATSPPRESFGIWSRVRETSQILQSDERVKIAIHAIWPAHPRPSDRCLWVHVRVAGPGAGDSVEFAIARAQGRIATICAHLETPLDDRDASR